MPEKTCCRCKETKPVDQFNKNRNKRYGVHNVCRECNKKVCSKWRTENKNYHREQHRKWVSDNKEHVAKYKRDWYDKNIQSRKEYDREWYAENAERRRKQARKWRQENSGRRAAYDHLRRAKKACAVPQRWVKSDCPDTNCYWCGVDLSTVTVHTEHLMPISLGGPVVPSNEAPACASCNIRKKDKHPLVWIAMQF